MKTFAWPFPGLFQAFFFCLVAVTNSLSPLKISAQLAPVIPPETSTYEADKIQLLRVTTFGNREINLPAEVQNGTLQVKNDMLENDIAKLEGRQPDMGRLAIDNFVLAERKKAARVATIFSRVWSSAGNQRLRAELAPLDGSLDAAISKCEPKDQEGKAGEFATLEDAKEACTDLEQISETVSKYSVPTPPGWPSIFAQDSLYKKRAGYGFLQADTAQLRRDKALSVVEKYKRSLITTDEGLLAQDQGIWLIEISDQNTTAFNVKYPSQQMADSAELLQSLKDFRQQIITENARYRAELMSSSRPHR